MQFAMIKEYDFNVSQNKIVLGEITETSTVSYVDSNKIEQQTHKYKVSLAYLLKMGSFKENEEYNLLLNTDSIQIRPKAIYKNDKGYYKKDDGKKIFFNKKDIREIENAIYKFKIFLQLAPDAKETSFDYKEEI